MVTLLFDITYEVCNAEAKLQPACRRVFALRLSLLGKFTHGFAKGLRLFRMVCGCIFTRVSWLISPSHFCHTHFLFEVGGFRFAAPETTLSFLRDEKLGEKQRKLFTLGCYKQLITEVGYLHLAAGCAARFKGGRRRRDNFGRRGRNVASTFGV